jgi:hypothetical protein
MAVLFIFMFLLFVNLWIQFMYTKRFFGNIIDAHTRFLLLYESMYSHIKNQTFFAVYLDIPFRIRSPTIVGSAVYGLSPSILNTLCNRQSTWKLAISNALSPYCRTSLKRPAKWCCSLRDELAISAYEIGNFSVLVSTISPAL